MTLARRSLLIAPAAWAGSAWASTQIQWVAGNLPPFAFESPGGARGFAHDLANAMAQRLDRPRQVTYLPWARAVRMAEQGPAYGVFPLARTPDREANFQWLVPLMTVRYGFYTLATETRLELEDLRPMRVGVLRGSPIAANLRAESFKTLVEAKDYRDLLRLLRERSLDAVYAGTAMLEAAMDEYGHPRLMFVLQTTLGEGTLYMAASRQTPAVEAQRWVAAYRELEDDGTVMRLRRRYIR
ncbi:MAG: transporter substrate-binding domain-containing protein [Burkholderiales bacterium]|nr:MAG: transporter substrate-binding domain-containing protein [Burkholderiales bacterium]